MDALIILSIGMVFASIERIIGSTWIGVGKPVVPMKVMGIAAVVNLASNIYFIPRLGIFGAGLSFTLAYLSALIIWYGIIFRKYLKSYKD
jgi:O-antigen/teichoic acid export membrane protein